jgi:beta-glucosidase
MILKRILVVLAVILILIGIMAVRTLHLAGAFKTIKPHTGCERLVIGGMPGPEDITIHPKTGLAYVSSDDRRARAAGRDVKGRVFVFDPKAEVPELRQLTLTEPQDFHPHGISLFIDADGRTLLFAVNHRAEGPFVEIFEVAGDALLHRESISHPLMFSPNDVLAVGPRSFYVTNDHGSRTPRGQMLENYLFLDKAFVLYFDGRGMTIAAKGIGYANGIAMSPDGATVYVAGSSDRSIRVFKRDAATGGLTRSFRIKIGSAPDNIELDASGSLWIAAHPKMLKFVKHAADPAVPSPSQVLRIAARGPKESTVEEVYLDDGREISGSSVAAPFPGGFLIGQVFGDRVLLCRRCREEKTPYLDPALPIERRVDDLVSRMTLEEKTSQMVHDAPAVDRLAVPAYNWWNECLHGVARSGRATVFPQAIGLAATWDSDLLYRVATAISDEARAKHHDYVRRGKRGIYQGLTFWSPNINLFRDPRWGRGMETYGEDPYLTGTLAVEFIKGLQGNDPRYLKLVATPKHFAVHSGPEPDRHTFDAVVDASDLRMTYLPHFEMAVREGRAFSVMCAYNRTLGKACCGSAPLLTDILRKEWGFEGYVVSDCNAISDIYLTHKIVATDAEAAALAVKSGTDLNCGNVYRSLPEAVRKGLIGEAEIDTAVKRLFRARFKLGMFDPAERVPYASIPLSVVDSAPHRELALEAARKSIVLLKNEGNLLPLRKDLKTIAVIGPNADDVEVLLGNYNGTPSDPVTPLRGIREKAGAATEVLYALGSDWAENLPALSVVPSSALRSGPAAGAPGGLRAEYFGNREFKGAPVLARIDPKVDFNWWDRAPQSGLDDDDFSVRWTGYLVPPVSGTYWLGGEGFNGFRIRLDDKLVAEFDGSHQSEKRCGPVKLEAHRLAKLQVDFFHRSSDAFMRLLWAVPGPDPALEAVEAARKADAVIVVLGLSPRLEGEEMEVPVEGFAGGDRITLDLPRLQEDLLQKIQAAGKPVVLVLLNGSALAVNWAADNVPAVVEAWYPGQAAGTALADVLFGDANPSGRLPVTFYKAAADLPPFTEYRMVGQTYRYFKGEPLYPFGYGLSYTTFEYSNLKLPESVEAGADLAVTVDVKNAGFRVGDEVVQLYVSDLEALVPVPIRSLQGYQRIHLQPGERRTVRFTVTPRQLSLIDKDGARVVEPGVFEIAVGGKQPGFTGRADAATTGVLTGRVEVRSRPFRIL